MTFGVVALGRALVVVLVERVDRDVRAQLNEAALLTDASSHVVSVDLAQDPETALAPRVSSVDVSLNLPHDIVHDNGDALPDMLVSLAVRKVVG